MESERVGDNLQILAVLAERVNFACQQNDVPLLRDISLRNDGEDRLADLTVEMLSEPMFVKTRTWHVDTLAPGDQIHLSDRRVTLDPGVLWELSEAVTATVVLRVISADAELARFECSVELLARNEWGGADYMPEMIAAFVTPNDPAVEKILKTASERLERAGLPSAIDGYQTGSPQRAAHLIGAIWSSIGSLSLTYANPPASFERSGQKIRTPSHIVDSRLATCLDLTLLFASCLEQAGLHPIIIFVKGHSLVGCWLQDEQFASVTIDEVSSIRKRMQLHEALVFETTLLTEQALPKFTSAMKQARDALAEEYDDRFELAVDIHRARMQRIRPISMGHEPEPKETEQESETSVEPVLDIDAFDNIPRAPSAPEPEIAEAPLGRLDRWQRKLLDLSLRNRLLNFKPTKRSIRLRCPEPDQLEDQLADGNKIQIMSSPKMMDEEEGRSAELHRQEHNEDVEEAYALAALARNEVVVDLPPAELDRRLIELFRAARTSLQEGGANTLFVAFGFLAWRKRDTKEEKRYRAPLILVPVRLERRSVRSGVRLTLHDDEPRVNPTLLQMLEQDFALKVPELSGPLPTDEHGLDVRGIWDAMTRAIREQEGWEVVEEATLSTFSFAKYLMWKDLVDRTEILKDNPVVRHLIDTPKDVYASEIPFPQPSQLDEAYPPEQTFTPLAADSSQLAAVMAAAQGKDFVLEGPPGTGKSQTISNMIAQCLAEGRTVLFVSEKTAALDVVYRRLRDVGLGEFCLELHSSKARKLDVLEQLRASWESQASFAQEEWQREAKRLAGLRGKLNLFVTHLHQRYPNGLTPYYAIGKVLDGRDVPRVTLNWPTSENHDQDSLQELRDIADRIDVDSAALGSIANSAFAGLLAVADWSPTWQRELIDAAKSALPTFTRCARRAHDFERACSLPEAPPTKARLDALCELALVLPGAHGEEYGFALTPQGPKLIGALKCCLDLLADRNKKVNALSCEYKREPLQSLEIEELQAIWAEADTKWWPRSVTRRRRVRKALRAATSDRGKPNAENDLPVLAEIHRIDAELAIHDALAKQTGGLWNGLDTRIDESRNSIEVLDRLQSALGSIAPNSDVLIETQTAVRSLLTDGNALLADGATVGKAAEELRSARARMDEEIERISALAGISTEDLDLQDVDDWPDALTKKLGHWIQEENRLRNWCAWRRVRDEALARGLGPLVEAVENGAVETEGVAEALEVNYCRWWISSVVDRDDVLREFVPAEHEHAIAEFAKLDEEFTGLSRSYIRAKLCGHLPAKDEITRSSEWGVLKRELEKKRRHKPLRQLVEEMPTALTKLTPCLLMSPLSIAQYLSPEQAQFDVVIFDEASQIPVWDAIGAIARGKQAVVVGDPKQLPPTSFFERADDEDYEDEDVERDLESILDECMGANLPVERLNWHYRSRHESLIAFSNQRYYGGGLVTFPAPVTEDRAVSYWNVPAGAYEKGGARINQEEAKALVADVMSRINDSEFVRAGLSIGVVTFNTEQQHLIENLLDEERRKHPEIESWFDDDSLEPIIVKNLESVQGDERDIIYFSVTYGPDRQGRVSMNFGPLNRDGGERRLNVAITRARHELRVFATLRPDQINLARTQALGVRDFKHFLEYADRGPQALAEATHITGGDFDSPFEQAVAAALANRGWQIHPQVGVSGFRIDLGIVHPDSQGVYLAGVECDGATYHRAATARDRDKLREGVLRGLGWEILRVWSTDWWLDSPGAVDKLNNRLEELLDASREAREAEAASRVEEHELDAQHVPEEAIDKGSDQTENAETMDLPLSGQGTGPYKGQERQPSARYAGGQASGSPGTTSPYEGHFADEIGTRVPYRECGFDDFESAIDADQFYEQSYSSVLADMVDAVIETEGPIKDDLLIRRIARLHGFRRAGRRIRDRVLKLARRRAQTTKEHVGTFFWPQSVSPEDWRWFRTPTSSEGRSIEDIAIEELLVLARNLRTGGRDKSSSVREMAFHCGVRRMSTAIRERLEQAYDAVAPLH